jgi:Carboxypeptidase regulatory-like domain/TonB dependent receptor-like, beta-barrel
MSRLSIICALLLSCLCASLRGQAVNTAEIAGVVTDSSGAAVPNATITVTQTETQLTRTTVSGVNGAYVLPNLPVGPYTLEVTAAGFATFLQKGILLSVGANVSIPVALPVGSVKQEVQVTANAQMVETHDTSISQVIDSKRVLDLPLNGRQATSLILLSGASANAASTGDFVGSKTYGSANIAGSTSISIAGGQANGTNFLMDGGDNNHGYSNVSLPFPFPDAIQEFSVQTSGLSARYGLHAGGVMNVVTKSGTNQIHGSLFEFLRNGNMNARNFFAPVHDSLKRNQFGGTAGGPVRKDRIFGFFGYQGTRIRTAPPQSLSFVPTQAARGGDFSQLESAGCQSNGRARTIMNPATGQPFPGGIVPTSLFNPQAVAILKYVPVADNPCGRTTYAVPSPEGENQYIGRGDWVISAKHSLFGRFFRANLSNPPSAFNSNLLFTNRAGLADLSQSLVIGDTYSFSPSVLNSLRLTGSKARINRYPQADFINPSTVGININSLAPNFLYFSISGYFNSGCGSCAPAVYTDGQGQIADDLDVIRGRHHLSMGVNWIYNQLNYGNVFLGNGNYSFNGQLSGDALVDFMLGVPSSFQQGNASLANPRQQYIGLYAQDDFKLSSRLQVHFGLRWEPFLPAGDKFNRIDHFSAADYAANKVSNVYVNAPAGMQFVGDPGIPQSFTSRKWADFSPRVGFAWDPDGKGRQTIRAAYSIFYDWPELNYSTHPGQGAPWGSTVTLSNPAGGLTNPFQGYPGGNPFPSPVPPGRNQAFPAAGAYFDIPLGLRPTYVQSWNLSYQRQIGANWLLSASYLGNKTTHQWDQTEGNPGVFIPGTCAGRPCSSTANLSQRRVLSLLNPTAGALYSTLSRSDDGANANYNGLLVSARHRFSANYTVLANYTWSHCINEGQFVGTLAASGYQNPFDRNADRGSCAFDFRHIFNLSLVASAPRFTGNRAARYLLSGWQIAPIVTSRSGARFTPVTGVDNSMTGVGLDRPNALSDPYVRNLTTLLWLSPAAFQANPAGTFGNAGVFSLVGPRYFNMDVGVSRSFAIHESHRLEARFEAFNSLNHTNFSTPVNSVQNARFGQITSAGDPRILQVAMKYWF